MMRRVIFAHIVSYTSASQHLILMLSYCPTAFNAVTIDVNILSYAVREERSFVQKIQDKFSGGSPELIEVKHITFHSWWSGCLDTNAKSSQLLHGVYASFRPGELVCLMGSSGAGKTTLLNVISGRAGGVLIGDIKVGPLSENGCDMSR